MAHQLTQSDYSSSELTASLHESTASSQESRGTSSTSARKGSKELWDHEDARKFKLFFSVALSFMVLGVLIMAGLFVAYGAVHHPGRPGGAETATTTASGSSLYVRDVAPLVPRVRTKATPRATPRTRVTSEAISMTESVATSEETADCEEPPTNGPTTFTDSSDEADNITGSDLATSPPLPAVPGSRARNYVVTPTRSAHKKNKGVPSKSLLCTYGAKLNSTMVFPPDGLCDFVFFDSLYKNNANNLDGPFSPNFDYFLTQAKENNATTYGAGLDYANIEEVQQFLDSNDAEGAIEDLLGHGIRHYGFLNTPATLLRLEDVKRAFQVLQAFHDILEDKHGPRYTVFAASLYSDSLLKSFASVLENKYVPDVLIMYGHFFAEDQAWPDCQIVPPTSVAPPNSGAYIYSLSTAHDNVMYLQSKDTTLAVSVAMFGRWYMPRYLDDGGDLEHSNYSLFSPCQETGGEQLGSVTRVCKHPMWGTKVYSTEHQAEYCFDKKMQRTFTFDSSKTLISKLCSEKRRVLSAKYAVAAFNLEYADSKNECGEGDFAQLRTLRQLVDYLDERFTDVSAYDGCVSIRDFSANTAGKKKTAMIASAGPADTHPAMAGTEPWQDSYVSMDDYGTPPYPAPTYARRSGSPPAAEKKRSDHDAFVDSKPLLLLRLFTIFVVAVVGFFVAFVMVTESGLFERREESGPASSPAPATTKPQPPVTAPTPVRRTTAHEPDVTEDEYPFEDNREQKIHDDEPEVTRAVVLRRAPLKGRKYTPEAAPNIRRNHLSGWETGTRRRKVNTHRRSSRLAERHDQGNAGDYAPS